MNFLIAVNSRSLLDVNRIRLFKSTSMSDTVYPLEIEQKLFQKPRKDTRQECLRQIIMESFREVVQHPEKYRKPFTIITPSKTWEGRKFANCKRSPIILEIIWPIGLKWLWHGPMKFLKVKATGKNYRITQTNQNGSD